MRVVFFGSSEFAVPPLEALFNRGDKLLCVVTQPDRGKGRGLKEASTAVCQVARALGVEVYQPAKIGEPGGIEFLKEKEADLFVVIAYGQILPQAVLDLPKKLSINVHASLLPKYRGAAPINWALIHGEKTTGLSVIKMAKSMDAGPLILQKRISISSSDDATTLEQKLSLGAAGVLLESLELIENDRYHLEQQDQNKVTLAPKLSREDGRIDWSKPADEVINLVRGCMGWPQAFTYLKKKVLKVFDAEISGEATPENFLAGQVNQVSNRGLSVVTGSGCILIKELQLEGKKRMKVEDFLLGHSLSVGERLLIK